MAGMCSIRISSNLNKTSIAVHMLYIGLFASTASQLMQGNAVGAGNNILISCKNNVLMHLISCRENDRSGSWYSFWSKLKVQYIRIPWCTIYSQMECYDNNKKECQ